MKKRLFRFLATTLAAIVTVTSVAPTSVYAAQTESQMTVEEVQEVLEETVSGNGTISDNSIETFGEEGKLNYLYLEKSYVETPSEQNIIVSFGDEQTVIAKATLIVEDYETRERMYYNSEDCMDNLVLFNMPMSTENAGIYEVVAVSVTTEEGKTKYVQLDKTGMDAVYYGVNEEVVLSEEEPVPEEEVAVVETQVVTFEEGEVADTKESEIVTAVEEALDEAETHVEDDTLDVEVPLSIIGANNMGTITATDIAANKATGNLVVVIDPGHDNTHAGARANGLEEEDLTLKIAQYCKSELEKYAGVTVYMTRTGGACPYPGTTFTVCNKNRVNYAQSVGADVYVSIHLNSASSASAKGAEVFYPNSSYNASIGQEGANLANRIVRQLAALGLSNRGIAIRNSGDNTRYPDGSLADYYGVIKNSKLAGFPAVIVEHAFLTNASDAAFLSKEENLKKLGIADATGIADYYGLKEAYNFTSKTPTVTTVNDKNGTFTVSITGVSPVSAVSQMRFAVWTEENGQDDMKWYVADNKGNGTFTKEISVTNHGSKAGTYRVHAYITDIRGNYHFVGTTACTVAAVKAKLDSVSTLVASNEKNVTVTANGVTDATSLRFGVWSTVNGQDDLVWYIAKNNGNGTWSANIPISNHKSSAGVYQVHAYAGNVYNSTQYLKATTFKIEGPTAGKVEAKNIDAGKGTFTVELSGVTAKAGVAEVKVAVWSKEDRSNLKWYYPSKQSDGSYAFNVNLENHGYEYGAYYIHAYVKDGNGISAVTTGTVAITQPKVVLSAIGNSTGSQFNIKASNVTYVGGVKGVRMAVWSTANGQDDLVWYTAQNSGNGTWSINVPVSAHKTAGSYVAHMYITDKNGKAHFGGSTGFTVEKPVAGKVTISNVDSGAGTFRADITGASAKTGIAEVRVAVWSKSDQSNMRWYVAQRQSNGSYYINVNLENHGYEYGTYYVHAYVKDNNGVQAVNTGSVQMTQPKVVMSATGNANETVFNIKASNVTYVGGVKGVRMAVWSTANGQDDLVWYTAKNSGNGTWSINVPVSAHKTAGSYVAHMYITDKNGKAHFGGSTGFTVEKPVAGKVTISNVDSGAGTFRADITGASAKTGIAEVRVAVWSKSDQSNMRWYVAQRQSNGSYYINVNLENHGYEYGTYYVHAYVKDNNGVQAVNTGSVQMTQPKVVMSATGNANETVFNIKASNVTYVGGVKGVRMAVWSTANGQDDLVWYTAKNSGNGTWSINVPVSSHKTAGSYVAHMYIIDKNGKAHFSGSTTFVVSKPAASSVSVVDKRESDGTFKVEIAGINSVSGVKEVRVAVWCATNKSDTVWYTATKTSTGAYQIGVDVRNHKNNIGNYTAHVYVTATNGIQCFVGSTTCSILEVDNLLYPIMGSTSVTVDQMVAYYNSVTSYPAYYATTDAPTLRQFCQIYIDECNAEGVKAEVAFVQAMKETNFLRYGGDVKINQFNFAGIGATGGGVQGNSFASVRIGIRAQVQHLKAYASTESLNQACVDPRFKYVARNTAPYCEWLGIPDNPYNKGWATAKGYGYNIVERIINLKKH